MDPQQWQSYNDAASSGASRRHNGSSQLPRDYAGQSQPPPPAYKYDQYHGGAPVAAPPVGAAATANSAQSPIVAAHLRDGNGDIPMHDAHDAHAGIKYPMRPHHQSHLSGGRSANLSPQEPSAAAQRYSPMDTLSPTSPYAPKPASGQFANAPPARQSPTRGASDYTQQSYYAARQSAQQLPPISPYTASPHDSYPSSAVGNMEAAFNQDPKSPRRVPVPSMAVTRGPVPEFSKIRSSNDLQPKVNAQPAFRRANPEGGFISVRILIKNSHELSLLSLLAATSSDRTSPRDLPHLQPQLQVRIVA